MTIRVIKPPKEIGSFQDKKFRESLTRMNEDVTELAASSIVVVSATTALSNERVLTGSSNVEITDGGGGSSVTVDLTDTAVTPGSYTNASITVDDKGRVTAASTGTVASRTESYVTMANTSGLTNERALTGSSNVTVTDGGAGGAVTLNLSDTGVTAATYTNPTSLAVDAKGRITSLSDVAKIPQVSSDPASPVANQVWILKTGGAGGGAAKAFVGFWITAAGSASYQLSYRTSESTTKRVTLS